MSAAERLSYYPPLLSVSFPRKYTVEEYLAIAAASDERLEYVNGCIIKNEAGGSYKHSLIASNIIGLLYGSLRGKPCSAHNGDVKIKTQTSYRLPDAFVVCGEPLFATDNETILLNPTVLVEVVSPESSMRDYVDKRLEYFEIESLQHYIIVEQEAPIVLLYTKNADNTLLLADYDLKKPIMQITALDISMDLREIYEKVFSV
jgi:Uma2 family endonuclease